MLLPHSAGSGGARQFLPNTFLCQLRIGVCDFDAGGGIALLHSRQHRGTAAGKGVRICPPGSVIFDVASAASGFSVRWMRL